MPENFAFEFLAQAETVPQTVLLPNAKIVLDRFHIVQHPSRAMNRLRVQIMNRFDRKSHEYKALKRYWKLIQQDSRKLSDKRFYRPTFRSHLTNKEILEKLLSYSHELRHHYELYQLLLFHFQEKQADHFFEHQKGENHFGSLLFVTFYQPITVDKESFHLIFIAYLRDDLRFKETAPTNASTPENTRPVATTSPVLGSCDSCLPPFPDDLARLSSLLF